MPRAHLLSGPLLLLGSSLVATGCLVHAPKTTYSSFGEVDLSRDAEVIRRFEAARTPPPLVCEEVPDRRTLREKQDGVPAQRKVCHDPAPGSEPAPVLVLLDSLPEGIDIQDGRVRVVDGYPHVLLGRATIVNQVGQVSKESLLQDAKALARAAGGNLVLLSFLENPALTDQQSALGATALVVRTDLGRLEKSKTKAGKVPFEI